MQKIISKAINHGNNTIPKHDPIQRTLTLTVRKSVILMGQGENKMETRKSELNYNENTPNQNLQNTA